MKEKLRGYILATTLILLSFKTYGDLDLSIPVNTRSQYEQAYDQTITGVIGHPRVNMHDNHVVVASDGRTMQIINNSTHWHVCTIGVYQFEVPPGQYDQWGNWRPGLSRVYPAGIWACY
jgi:hypothetical protein